MPAPGTTANYRPIPRDFDEMFVLLGWSSICDHYGAGWKTVVKWLRIRGRDRLREARAAYVRENGPARSPVKEAGIVERHLHKIAQTLTPT